MPTDKTMLSDIQVALKAPKGQENDFGKYKYRSCSDIVEAVKPLLAEHKATLIISDEMIQLGDRYYIKATATLSNGTATEAATGWAREALDKKGMDVAQITGAASSYARKYALNGLFAIDDTKDADTQDNSYKPHKFANGEAAKVQEQIRSCLETGDEMGIKQILDEYKGDAEAKIKVWGLFSSAERATIKALLE